MRVFTHFRETIKLFLCVKQDKAADCRNFVVTCQSDTPFYSTSVIIRELLIYDGTY
jgi:hypothetical protein